MIKSIELKNFQSHKHTKIVFDKGITELTGHSRAGKTATYRAIKKIQTNKPLGLSLVSSWAKTKTAKGADKILEPLEINLELDNGTISYYKDNSVTKYVVNGVDYKAVSSGVPAEVTDLLNMNEVNFAGQHDAPFLIRPAGLGGAEASRFLNSLVNFSDADEALSVVEKHTKNTNANINVNEKNIDAVDKKLTKYNNLEDMLEIVDEYEKVKASFDKDIALYNNLEKVTKQYHSNKLMLEALKDTTLLEAIVAKIQKLITSIDMKKRSLEELTKLKTDYQHNKDILDKAKDITKLESIIIAIEKEQFILEGLLSKKTSCGRIIDNIEKSKYSLDHIKSTKKLTELVKNANKLLDEIDKIKYNRDNIIMVCSSIEKHKNSINDLEKDLKEKQTALKKLGKICPNCKGTGIIYG